MSAYPHIDAGELPEMDGGPFAWLADRPMAVVGGWRCVDCGRPAPVYAPSITDPHRCSRCAHARRTQWLRQHYAWKPAVFGRYRRVPPSEAAGWPD